jgi:hypothetical protein
MIKYTITITMQDRYSILIKLTGAGAERDIFGSTALLKNRPKVELVLHISNKIINIRGFSRAVFLRLR